MPFIHSGQSTPKIMGWVIACLVFVVGVQAIFASFLVIKNQAIILLTVVACEYWFVFLRQGKAKQSIQDGSAIVTAIILAFGMPAEAPIYVLVVSGCIAMVVKHMYGGLGMNIFNPAMAAYVFAMALFPVEMSNFILQTDNSVDATSQATALVSNNFNTSYLPIKIAIIISGILLIILKIIKWQVVLASLLGFCLVVALHSVVNNLPIIDFVYFNLFSGAILFGAFFVVTDPTGLPHYPLTQIIYAVIVGTLVATIRLYGSYVEGVAFAVLLGNMLVPLLNKLPNYKAA